MQHPPSEPSSYEAPAIRRRTPVGAELIGEVCSDCCAMFEGPAGDERA